MSNDRLVLVTLAKLEVLMFNDPSERRLRVRVVDNRVSLVVTNILLLGLKLQTPLLKFTELVAKELVDHSGKDNPGILTQVFVLLIKEVHTCFHVD